SPTGNVHPAVASRPIDRTNAPTGSAVYLADRLNLSLVASTIRRATRAVLRNSREEAHRCEGDRLDRAPDAGSRAPSQQASTCPAAEITIRRRGPSGGSHGKPRQSRKLSPAGLRSPRFPTLDLRLPPAAITTWPAVLVREAEGTPRPMP